ncbi:MAG TPA: R3H domain-containing nucleic acid-binding protein [Dermatophilaceae bacterium]|nr:R3H domain-containing nucleic acid-binding protein [Dermatophilaceae bacterium]
MSDLATDDAVTTDAGMAAEATTTPPEAPADPHQAPAEPSPVAEPGDTATGQGEPSSIPARAAQLEREGEVAADFLERLLDIADLDGDIDVDIDGDRASIAIVDSEEGQVPRRLVGPGAKVLEALQELTRLAVQSATGERSRLMLDIAGHRATRKVELIRLAQSAVEQVQAGSTRVVLEPMSAFERKIVHDHVSAAGLTSQSEGTEPTRFVVVLPGE